MSSISLADGVVGVRRASIEAVITRADGTVEHLGVIAEADFPPARPSFLKRIGAALCRKS